MKKRNQKQQLIPLIILSFVLLCFFVLFLFNNRKENDNTETIKTVIKNDDTISEKNDTSFEEAENNSEKTFQPIYTNAGIVIQEIKSYAGKYLEDGTDEIVSNIMAVLVKNETEEAIQLADLSLTDGNGNVFQFRITTLLPWQEMLILESDRAVYNETLEITDTKITNLALFSEAPELNEDIFEISDGDHLLTVKNISEETIPAARVCYKSISGDIYIGGITYSVSIPELQPGEMIEIPAKHYTKDASEVVFVTYAK